MARASAASYPSPQTVVEQPKLLFSEKEMKEVSNIVKVEEDLAEVRCGCTSKMHGDFPGILTIHRDGDLSINCQCIPDCYIENATPGEFISHAKTKISPSQWPKCIWVHNAQGFKTNIQKTPLLRYFKNADNVTDRSRHQKFKFHGDEYLKCSQCGLERRFRVNDKKDCRAYHDAILMGSAWTCSMHPSKINCNSGGRRKRMLFRGCPSNASCKGCIQCVCLGCANCRFSDCDCRECEDFTNNVRAQNNAS